MHGLVQSSHVFAADPMHPLSRLPVIAQRDKSVYARQDTALQQVSLPVQKQLFWPF